MSRRIRSDERGATAILVAASLFLLMGMAALTIDWGAGTNQRRQNQSAADFGVLAGAQFANIDTACGGYSTALDIAACNATNEIIDVVDGNLGLAPGTLDWAGCVDSTVAATYPEFTSGGGNNGFASPMTDCVRFTENMQQVRVVIPTVDVDTTFGKVLGRDIIATSAFAHAKSDFKEASKVIPFALPSNLSSASHECLKTQATLLNWAECDDTPVSGNFGNLDIRLYGNEKANTVTACTGSPGGMLISNIARGVDHPMETQPDAAGVMKIDGGPNVLPYLSVCPIFDARPNSSLTQPGVGDSLDLGLTRGGNYFSADGSSYSGRLTSGSGVVVRNPQGSTPITRLDDIPAWYYLLDGNTSPGFCSTTYDATGIDTTVEMRDCLAAWTPGVGIIFEGAIKDAKRYAFVPEFHLPFTSTGPYRYKAFRPIYLNNTYYGCTPAGPGTCEIVHTPGIAGPPVCPPQPTTTCGMPGNANRELQGVTAFILKNGMLPDSALDPFPDDDDVLEYALTR